MIAFEEFRELAKSGNVIPVYQKVIADLETPVSVLARFCNDENVFLLESVENGERFGRYSFVGIEPREIFEVKPGVSDIDDLKKKFASLKPVVLPELPPLLGGAIGFMAYESVNAFEKLPTPKDHADAATAEFLITDKMVIFDNLKHIMLLVVSVETERFASLREAYDYAASEIAKLQRRLKEPVKLADAGHKQIGELKSNRTREEFIEMVKKAKQYIYEGEIIQVVLSERFCAPCELPPLQLYRALRLINPSPYTFFLKIGGKVLVGSSPETLAKLENREITLRPIAGTKPRGKDEQSDRHFAHELINDPKERAEHLMLVDLARNDAGRVAKSGSVQVKDFMTIERYSHVMHLVSTVNAVLDDKEDAYSLLKSVFPAGTLSGAPKIRAMEIIHELEPCSRGFYGGAIGYFSFDGNMDLAITIRTLLQQDGKITLQAGAGIVHDSIPEMEYNEVMNKSRALFEAIKTADNNLGI